MGYSSLIKSIRDLSYKGPNKLLGQGKATGALKKWDDLGRGSIRPISTKGISSESHWYVNKEQVYTANGKKVALKLPDTLGNNSWLNRILGHFGAADVRVSVAVLDSRGATIGGYSTLVNHRKLKDSEEAIQEWLLQQYLQTTTKDHKGVYTVSRIKLEWRS